MPFIHEREKQINRINNVCTRFPANIKYRLIRGETDHVITLRSSVAQKERCVYPAGLKMAAELGMERWGVGELKDTGESKVK